MKIENAQYFKDPSTDKNASITATIDGVVCGVPLDPDNRHYAEILKQVKEGTLTIKDAD
jgi:hypothetical protein